MPIGGSSPTRAPGRVWGCSVRPAAATRGGLLPAEGSSVGCVVGAWLNDETFLGREPVFTRGELTACLAAEGVALPRLAARRVLSRWRWEGRVVEIRSGLYAVVPDGLDPATVQPMPFLVASKMAPDAVVSYHAAMDYWGCSYSMWFVYAYSATRPPPDTSYKTARYRGVKFHERLTATGNEQFDVVEKPYAGGTVRVASLERTLVDVLAVPSLGGDWSGIWQCLSLADTVDVDMVAAYCALLDSPFLGAKVGFFLDQHRDLWDIDDDDLAVFRPPTRHEPYRFDDVNRQPCQLVKEWNLVVPTSVLEQSWEESWSWPAEAF